MATKNDKAFDFSAKLKELETISLELEAQELDLDRGINQYEAGMKLVKELKEHLETATNRVEEIKRQYTAASASEQLEHENEADDAPTPRRDGTVSLDDIPF